MEMLEETHSAYDFYQLFISPADAGHAGTARDRTYVIGCHSSRTTCTYDPELLLGRISRRMRRKVRTRPSDYFFADTIEVALEAKRLAERRGICFQPGERDLSYLLTEAERHRLKAYEDAFRQKFRQEPGNCRDLVVFLSDNPSAGWTTWSAVSGAIPTFRRNAKHGLMWAPFLRRWMVAREKLACLGWPVLPSMAAAMSSPVVPVRDIARAADLAGNAMHFNAVGLAQLIALSCCSPSEPEWL